MHANRKRVLFFALLLLLGFAPAGDRQVADFTLKNVTGKAVSLADYRHAKGFIIVFTCNHCPFAKLYYKRLNELNRKYSKLQVPLLAISSADTVNYDEDTYPNMQRTARAQHFSFPYLYDASQQVARNFAAQNTPHAFVIWKVAGKWVVKYAGAIDDNGVHPELVKNHYVGAAVAALLNGKEVVVRQTKSIGCGINFRK